MLSLADIVESNDEQLEDFKKWLDMGEIVTKNMQDLVQEEMNRRNSIER